MGASNTESNKTFAASSTGDYNGWSVHAPAGRSVKADPFSLNTESNQTSFPAATSNGDGSGRLSEHSPTATAERVDSFSPFIKSNQTPSTAAASNINGLSVQSPKEVDLFGLNTESNQTSSAAATSDADGSSSIYSTPARTSEKGDHLVGLNKESSQTSSSRAAAPSNEKVPSAQYSTASSEKAIGTSSKFSSFSSSSSPDSTLDDPFLEFDIEHEESTSTIIVVPRQGKQSSGASENGKSDHHQIPISTLDPALTYEHGTPKSSPRYLFESPQTQVMERCNNSKYRIPSSVFARNKSTAPDWSMASNESLFSIQMGGASFTRDHYNYFRPGELGLQGESSTSSQNKFNFSPKTDAPVRKAATDHRGKSQELSIGVENMKRVPSEGGLEKSNADQGRISHYSVESNSSTKSFAFPVLTGDKDKITSTRIGSSVTLCPETPKTRPPQQHAQIDHHERQPSLKPADESIKEPKSPMAAPPRNRWFSCFPCCS